MQELKSLRKDLLSHAYALTRDFHKAQDLYQDTVLRVNEKLHLYKEGNFPGWVKTIMYNIFVSRYRSDMRRIEKINERPLHIFTRTSVEETPADALVYKEVDPRIIQAIMDLPKHYRLAFILHFQDYSTNEIAKILGCPAGTIMSRVHRAKAALQTALEGMVFA